MTTFDPPQPNLPLLRKAVEWAEAEAAKTEGECMWNQSNYSRATACGTAYCIAGYAVSVQPGYSETIALVPNLCDCSTCLAVEPTMTATPYIDGMRVDFDNHGREVLGLTVMESVDLFAGGNSIKRVRELAEQIAERAGERL